MLSFLKNLLLLIDIDQETIFNWFGIEIDNVEMLNRMSDNGSAEQISSNISLTTFKLVIESLLAKLQNGLSLPEIESLLIVILFVRFLILAIRYNLKTSFYITCIGLIAGYLWYRHLIDIISMYRLILLKLPWVNKLGADGIELRALSRQLYLRDLKLSEYPNWYNPIQLIYNGFTKGIIVKQEEVEYYIDPISMIIANLPDSEFKSTIIVPNYYRIYNNFIPRFIGVVRKFSSQISNIAAYTIITRINKKYCPYLVRWHWTFLLILGLFESVVVNFIYRCYYFQTAIILPQLRIVKESGYLVGGDTSLLLFQNQILNSCICVCVVLHVGFIMFGLLHAICGQYFYIPFLVENVELHIGPRPTNSIYSGGHTAWQDPEEKEKRLKQGIPKLWYGWFGRGTKRNFSILKWFKQILKNFRRYW
jgi:hypothetical protein